MGAKKKSQSCVPLIDNSCIFYCSTLLVLVSRVLKLTDGTVIIVFIIHVTSGNSLVWVHNRLLGLQYRTQQPLKTGRTNTTNIVMILRSL